MDLIRLENVVKTYRVGEIDVPVLKGVSFSIRRVNQAVYRECTSFSKAPLECRAGEAPAWSPKTGGLVERPLPEAPPPAVRKTQRLAQMRELARRFTATCFDGRTDTPTRLRLLPQPIYRYEDDKAGVVDGALLAFVVSNDPELFLLLEAARDKADAAPQWRYNY